MKEGFGIVLYRTWCVVGGDRAVMAEAARVLVDGGMFILTDSVQLGDRPFQVICCWI